MKFFAIFIASICLFMTLPAFACGGCGYGGDGCGSSSGCGYSSDSCGSSGDCGYSGGACGDCSVYGAGCPDSICGQCACTDPECVYGRNNCLSKETCCEAFGNVGAN